jgi:hypothetical protein
VAAIRPEVTGHPEAAAIRPVVAAVGNRPAEVLLVVGALLVVVLLAEVLLVVGALLVVVLLVVVLLA